MSFMKPSFHACNAYLVETDQGCTVVPEFVESLQGYNTTECELPNEMFFHFQDYLTDSGEIESVEFKTGMVCYRLSAPGFMDATEWAMTDDIESAVKDMTNVHGDGFDKEDWQHVVSCLEGFDEFWDGYLVCLAFTGTIDSENGGEPIVSNPGGDIRDVVDSDDVKQWLTDDQHNELVASCVGFWLDLCDLFGNMSERFDDSERNRIGNEFHYSRNGHGTGLWDSDNDYTINGKDARKSLHAMAGSYGSAEMYASLGVDSAGNPPTDISIM